jgi:diguanylate cyclase (GGDEF)-like protein
VVLLGAGVAALGLGIAHLGAWWAAPPKVEPWWVVVLIAVAFVAGEQLALHVEFRRDALTVTLTEVPTALALMFLPLPTALLARLAASLVVLAVILRQRPTKVLFNLCLQTGSLSLGYATLFALRSGPWTEASFLDLLLAVMVVTTVDALAVVVVISLYEGNLGSMLREEVHSGLPRTLITSVTATIAAALATAWPVVALALIVPIVGVWSVLRSNAQTRQRLRDLEQLQELNASLGESLHRSEIASVAVGQIKRLLRAERVAVVLFDMGDLGAHIASTGELMNDLPQTADEIRWLPFIEAPAAVVEPDEFAALGIVIDSSSGNTLVAPIRTGSHAVGLLVVAERAGISDAFDDSDLLRAATIVDRLGMALRNAMLLERIEHEAWHDSLTDLPNRTMFERRLDEALDGGNPTGRVGMLMLGVDRFGEVNSTLGHQVGDRVLVELAARIRATVAPGTLVARLAGDEFGILLVDIDEHELMEMARRVVGAAERRLNIGDFEVVVTLSVGAALCPDAASNAALMLRRADMAMHLAKTNHSGAEIYRGDLDQRTPERLSMLGDLKLALEHGNLDVHFQPKVDLRSGRIVGAEALVRWNHPQRGFVPPIEFVQLAENTGLITTLTDQVLRKSISTIRLLNDLGFHLDVSLNLSTIDLLDDLLAGRVERILADNGVPPDQLTLEITETALLADSARTLQTAEALRRLGTHLSIDDFGTGYSSFSYLRVLPVSELKVDRSFVTNLLEDERDEVIVRSTIDLGHNLGLRVVAEGVEDMATLDRLRLLGCDLVQGYGIAKPMPFDRFLVFLNSGGYEPNRLISQPAPAPSFTPRIVSTS